MQLGPYTDKLSGAFLIAMVALAITFMMKDSGDSAWIDTTDTPPTYNGFAGECVAVSGEEDGLIYFRCANLEEPAAVAAALATLEGDARLDASAVRLPECDDTAPLLGYADGALACLAR